jgi:unsaturated chondroitin disaccharide hydrolase
MVAFCYQRRKDKIYCRLMIELCSLAELRPQLESAFAFAQRQVRQLAERDPDFYPMYTQGGKWRHSGEAWTHWCDGFLPGMMWIFFERTRDENWRRLAERYSRPLEPRRHDRTVHDLGFIFTSTYDRWFRLTGDPALDQVLIDAGRTLALRFQPKGEYLCSFIDPESLFIDIMMNVPVIFYAAIHGDDQALYQLALQHCLTTRRYLVRGDGSTSHEGIFDVGTGEFLRQTTHQGYRGDSCWSRGLTWALYGFGTVYTQTRDARFLRTAEACAEYYMSYAPPDGVPPWDFDAPAESRRQVDSSAAAVAAMGLWQLSKISNDAASRRRYRQYALNILNTLMSDEYLAIHTAGWEGILKHGVYHIHKGLGVDESVMWGDYFFVEAVCAVLAELEQGR